MSVAGGHVASVSTKTRFVICTHVLCIHAGVDFTVTRIQKVVEWSKPHPSGKPQPLGQGVAEHSV